MNTSVDYYRILELKNNATESEIKKSFRTLSKQYHPDVNPDNNKEFEEKFKSIAEAYAILGDKTKKADYDKKSHFGNNYDPNYGTYHSFGNGGYDPFGQMKQAYAKAEESRRKALELSIVMTVTISLSEAYSDVTLTKTYKRRVPCNTCNGCGYDDKKDVYDCELCNNTGKDVNTGKNCKSCKGSGALGIHKCETCKGRGLVEKEFSFNIQNPSRFINSEEQQFVHHGHGNYSDDISDLGHLIINVKIEENSKYSFQNGDIYYTLDLHYQDVIDGIKVQHEHLDGKVYAVQIPEKCKDGNVLKLAGKGIIYHNPYNGQQYRGNLLLTVNVIIDYDRV